MKQKNDAIASFFFDRQERLFPVTHEHRPAAGAAGDLSHRDLLALALGQNQQPMLRHKHDVDQMNY
jgi:hypothetical protein